jgi:hypothetical protein
MIRKVKEYPEILELKRTGQLLVYVDVNLLSEKINTTK